ncbi:MAG TPA: hypothetical protein PLA90_10135 [Candidatus Sumerlaeota bacterium]|nr:hypothetical protein [Candidatus Sumerlaeota bacterium]HPS01890.1 hypothetical protein [Candidatus Sumerlaeota bacterium]
MNEQLEKTKEFLIANIRMVAFVVGLVLLGSIIALNTLYSGALPPPPAPPAAPAAGGGPGGATPAGPGTTATTGGTAAAATSAVPAPVAIRLERKKNTIPFEKSAYARLGTESLFMVGTAPAAEAAPAPAP